jgi:uncharacterized protein DUF6318
MRRVLALFVMAVLAMGSAGCRGSEVTPNFSDPGSRSASPSAAGTGVSPAASSAPSSAGGVPVDQIPPGRPTSWVPAGVPTTGKYQEPGDVVPKFTLAMFEHTEAGALAVAGYYVDGLNWALATQDPIAFLVICDSARCKSNGDIHRGYKSKNQHVVGARGRADVPTLLRAKESSGAEWVVRVKVASAAGRLLDESGTTIRRETASEDVLDIRTQWNGRMWRISDVFLAG